LERDPEHFERVGIIIHDEDVDVGEVNRRFDHQTATRDCGRESPSRQDLKTFSQAASENFPVTTRARRCVHEHRSPREWYLSAPCRTIGQTRRVVSRAERPSPPKFEAVSRRSWSWRTSSS